MSQIININRLVLHYTCGDGHDTIETVQPLADIVDSGTLVCEVCDRDMDLLVQVELLEETLEDRLARETVEGLIQTIPDPAARPRVSGEKCRMIPGPVPSVQHFDCDDYPDGHITTIN